MRKGWTYRRIGDVCTVIGGATPKTEVKEFWGGKNYWITPADLDGRKYQGATPRTITDAAVEKTNLQLLPVGTVLLSSRAPIGKVAITTVPMYCNQGFKNIICPDSLLNEFVYWFLFYNKDYLNSLGTGATFKEISKKTTESVLLPVPPLSEQERIVAELDLLQGIIDKQNAQLKELDTLAQSIFYDMFGDPVENEKGWPLSTLLDISTGKLSYGSGASAIDYDGKIRYIRITDIDDNGSLRGEAVSPSDYSDKYLLHDGDILFARTGATVGKTYLHKKENGNCIYAGYLIRLVPNKDLVLPEYVFGFTKTLYYKRFVALAQKAVAQPNINAEQYGSLLIGVPPISLQQSFATKIEAIERQKASINASIAETQKLFDYTMDKYFG